jgi:hypothetical protein
MFSLNAEGRLLAAERFEIADSGAPAAEGFHERIFLDGARHRSAE